MADLAMRAVSAAFPALCAVSLGLPFAAGWGDRRQLARRTGHLLWAGLVRVTLLQHVTWSVNSLCHVIGTRPFITRRHDRATNLWLPALLSLGESWHSMHHSDPACARHGADPRQIEISAAVIRIFERLGLGHQRALARPRLPGVPPPLSGSALASAGTPDSEALISPAPT